MVWFIYVYVIVYFGMKQWWINSSRVQSLNSSVLYIECIHTCTCAGILWDETIKSDKL